MLSSVVNHVIPIAITTELLNLNSCTQFVTTASSAYWGLSPPLHSTRQPHTEFFLQSGRKIFTDLYEVGGNRGAVNDITIDRKEVLTAMIMAAHLAYWNGLQCDGGAKFYQDTHLTYQSPLLLLGELQSLLMPDTSFRHSTVSTHYALIFLSVPRATGRLVHNNMPTFGGSNFLTATQAKNWVSISDSMACPRPHAPSHSPISLA